MSEEKMKFYSFQPLYEAGARWFPLEEEGLVYTANSTTLVEATQSYTFGLNYEPADLKVKLIVTDNETGAVRRFEGTIAEIRQQLVSTGNQ